MLFLVDKKMALHSVLQAFVFALLPSPCTRTDYITDFIKILETFLFTGLWLTAIVTHIDSRISIFGIHHVKSVSNNFNKNDGALAKIKLIL